jgi:hypothetical protein
VAMMTLEDALIWSDVAGRFVPGAWTSGNRPCGVYLCDTSMRGDIRDARLMHDAEQYRGQWSCPAEAWLCEWQCTHEKCEALGYCANGNIV